MRLVAAALALGCALAHGAAPPLQLEELTWPELRDRVAAGTTIVLLPIGGTEQNGPHIALGKHNARVQALAARIAQRLGNALVAPVLAYVPEGRIDPASGHIAGRARSASAPRRSRPRSRTPRAACSAGLKHVVLLGDHGGYRASLDRVAARVPGVHALREYYRAARIGEHGGRDDTALTMALAPRAVRGDVARSRPPSAHGDGAAGDPRTAGADDGERIAARIVDESVAAIRLAVQRQSPR